jgi:hypothetical protein
MSRPRAADDFPAIQRCRFDAESVGLSTTSMPAPTSTRSSKNAMAVLNHSHQTRLAAIARSVATWKLNLSHIVFADRGWGAPFSRWGVARDKRCHLDLGRYSDRSRGVHRQLSMACIRRS